LTDISFGIVSKKEYLRSYQFLRLILQYGEACCQ